MHQNSSKIITEYTILQYTSSDRLAKEIIAKLNEGWHLQGGASIYTRTGLGELVYCQTLVKYK